MSKIPGRQAETGDKPPVTPVLAQIAALIASLSRWWAMTGGVLILILSVMAAASAASNLFFGRPFSADHELVKHVTAIAIFMFLPYCQISGANITLDFFTDGLSERAKQAMSAFSSLFALAFAVLLFVQMLQGFQSYIRFQEVTPVLRLPLWTAFPPILLSLALLAAASFINLAEGLRRVQNPQYESGAERS
ncbi:TRAP transporter small permease [Chelativorans oligotrophicus]|uniref:TRAP transporter small permease protein n=1 Tax=Chelativorans sp. (strain BNC1) TaxID=266779 RepID=Q11FF1_CHESB|nr:TRAP transporter small permease [Chelativorans oligotrophicus]